jgi:hypothetical protein
MYAANNETSGLDLYKIQVTATGFGTAADYPKLVPAYLRPIHYDAITGHVYADDGKVIDPEIGIVVGTFNASGIVVPDGALEKVFIVGQTKSDLGTSNYTIQSFSMQTFAPLTSWTVTNVAGTPRSLIRWGTNGLALSTRSSSTGAGAIYFVDVTWNSLLPSMTPSENVQRTW